MGAWALAAGIVAIAAAVGIGAVVARQAVATRRLRAEVDDLRGHIVRQERLASMGQLVSSVAHEINNPLQAIVGFAELMRMQGDLPESIRADVALIHKEGTRACGMIRNLTTFTRQQPDTAVPVRLGDVIAAVAELRRRRLESADIELCVEDRAVQPVCAVFAELQQVLLNLVVNAEHAIQTARGTGRITIRSRDLAGQVALEVEDTGPGLSTADEARVFEAFFTTKPVGEGTGLGLAISRRIIDSLGGRIGYRHGEGGAVFYVELPAVSVETV